MFESLITRSKVLKDFQCKRILDIGTGKGIFLRAFLRSIKSYDISFGCDPSKEQLEVARDFLKNEKVNLILADGMQLPFLDNEFDIVTISDALHHFENVEKVLNEVHRVLKKEGLLLINEAISDNLTAQQDTYLRLGYLMVTVDQLHGEVHNYTFSNEQVKKFIKIDEFIPIEEFIYEEKNMYEIFKDRISLIYNSIDEKIEKVSSTAEYEQLQKEGELIKSRIKETGIDMLKHTVLIYKKK